MKKFFRFLMAAAVLSSASVSCSNDDPEDGPIPPEEAVQTEAISPEGVSLYASDITDSDFVIRTAMGEKAVAYIFDVAPVAKVYNDWVDYNSQQIANGSAPVENFDDYIVKRLQAKNGTGGYTFRAELDLQWGESAYKQHQLIHTIDYMVMCLGLSEGDVEGELTVLRVPLHKTECIGNPMANISLISDYRQFEYTFTKNEEATAFYQLSTQTTMVEEIENWVAENKEKYDLPNTFMRDLICCYVQSPHMEDFDYKLDFGDNAVAGFSITVLTVGLDENLTPNTEYLSKKAEIQPKKGLKKAKINEIKFTNIAATFMEFEYDVDWEVTKSFFCNAVDETGKSVAMGYYPGATWKQTLLAGGYGQNKANATVEPRYNFINLEPDHEYTLYIVAKNWEDTADFYYGDELYDGDKVVEIPFKTKPMVLDRPEDSKSVINVTCSNEQRQSFRIDYEWNDDTVCIYETVLWDKADPGTSGLIEDPYDYEAAKKKLFEVGRPHATTSIYSDRSTTWTGYEPGNTYHYYIIAEDKDGVFGKMIHLECSTKPVNGGPNPVATVTGKIETQKDGVTKKWVVTFESNEDTTHMRYMIGTQTFDGEGLTEEEKIDKWTDILLGEQGMQTTSLKTSRDLIVTRYSQHVALCIPYGLTEDNQHCEGELAYLLFDPATLQSNVVATVRPFQVPVK